MDVERDLGRLEGQMSAMKETLDGVKSDIETLHKRMDEVLTVFSEARGGWKVVTAIAGASIAVGGFVTSLAHKLRWFG